MKLAALFEGGEAMEKKKLQELLDEYEKAMITLEQNYLALDRIVKDMQGTYPSSDVTQDERENWFWGFMRLLMILRDSHKEPIERARETFEQIKTEVFKMTA